MRERDAYKSGSVWSGIALCGRTDHHVFSDVNVNSHTCRDDILDAYVRLYTGAIVNGVAGPTELLRVGGRRMFRCSGEMGRRAVPFPTLPGVSGRRDGLR
ncbi:hypothetical protein TNCV_2126081 [Trichonephila clavipes]|nr:hypothetical protein TNCV_2126081 [Trichonephila clavipes]